MTKFYFYDKEKYHKEENEKCNSDDEYITDDHDNKLPFLTSNENYGYVDIDKFITLFDEKDNINDQLKQAIIDVFHGQEYSDMQQIKNAVIATIQAIYKQKEININKLQIDNITENNLKNICGDCFIEIIKIEEDDNDIETENYILKIDNNIKTNNTLENDNKNEKSISTTIANLKTEEPKVNMDKIQEVSNKCKCLIY